MPIGICVDMVNSKQLPGGMPMLHVLSVHGYLLTYKLKLIMDETASQPKPNEMKVKLNFYRMKGFLECGLCNQFMRVATIAFDCFAHRCK